jgi:hypothetical protein
LQANEISVWIEMGNGGVALTNFERILAPAVIGLCVFLALPASSAAAEAQATAVICSNPVSGAHWQITIDYQKSTVDSYPADITGAQISWFDPKDGGYYSIDRQSGDLITALGSSTGGWLRHNHCSLGKPR